jgi:hypothetical protein
LNNFYLHSKTVSHLRISRLRNLPALRSWTNCSTDCTVPLHFQLPAMNKGSIRRRYQQAEAFRSSVFHWDSRGNSPPTKNLPDPAITATLRAFDVPGSCLYEVRLRRGAVCWATTPAAAPAVTQDMSLKMRGSFRASKGLTNKLHPKRSDVHNATKIERFIGTFDMSHCDQTQGMKREEGALVTLEGNPSRGSTRLFATMPAIDLPVQTYIVHIASMV